MNAHLLPYPYNQSLQKPYFSPLCKFGAYLLQRCYARANPLLFSRRQWPPVTLICMSDTHNGTCLVPNGDILIHTGDLTQNGTFNEIQAQLDWLKSLPHPHKIVIAGNHDLLLDDEFMDKFPYRVPDIRHRKGKGDLDWGDIIYLQDSSVTITFPDRGDRRLKIFGSPKTPEFGGWAFQYPVIRDVWTNRIPDDADIVLTHGPPLLHGDVKLEGDGFLLKELRRVKPEVVVCGHIHDGRGSSSMLHDGLEELAEEIQMGWKGVDALVKLLILVMYSWLKLLVGVTGCKFTTVVNAAIAPSGKNKNPKDPIELCL